MVRAAPTIRSPAPEESGSIFAHERNMLNPFRSMPKWRIGFLGASSAAFAVVLLLAPGVAAQIKEPGAHANYSVELEPHAVLWWRDRSGNWDSTMGLGLGLRAAIPIVKNGFVRSINNSVAIGFGADWGRYGHQCWGQDQRRLSGDCVNNEFWFPVVMQWNFYLTKAFSVFGEPGVAIRYSQWSRPNGSCVGPGGATNCDLKDSATGIEPAFYLGGRVGNDAVRFTFRVGWPYASVGASFFL